MKLSLNLSWFSTPTKKQKIALGVASVAALALIGAAVYAYRTQTSRPVADCTDCTTPTPTETTPSIPTPSQKVANLINGQLVESGNQNVAPLAVMIENHPDARPQAGLGQADLVFEAIAEGGITRFMAVYADPRVAVKVGPVRSARTYYVDFATELKAFYAHVGGSEPALAQISRTGVLDLNQFAVGEPTYKRDFSRKVALEHTMYSSTEKLWNYATGTKGWAKTADIAPWLFQDDVAAASRPASQTLTVDFSSASYKVSWAYDPASNGYARTMAGSAHKDANTGNQITAKNIVLQEVGKSSLTESNGKQIWDYNLTGTGKATVIQNGTVIKGSWKKSGTERTRYYDEAGKEISFVRGTTWVEITHPETKVTIQ